MRPLTTSLTPAQLTALLDLPAEAVDALLESGRLLCHVKNGEPRIPLAQAEELFRDVLLRLYRAEAGGMAEPIEEREPAVVEESPPLPLELVTPRRDEEPAEEVVPEPPQPRVKTPPREPAPDQRRAPRYVPLRQIGGNFGETKFRIVQMSGSGLRIRHREPLIPGDEAKLSFALMRPARSFVMRARVVWTSLAKQGEEVFSISGLRVIEHAERLTHAIELLLAVHELQPERRTRERRGHELSQLSGVSDDEIALITSAMQKFANDPVEASRWYSRARFALSDEEVRRAAPPRPSDRDEVLGIWEYLERQVEIPKVADVVSWSRG